MLDKNKVYVTSDLHLFHKNIIKYCNRPYSFDWDGVRQMNEDIIKAFDELPDDSIIINNGDICLNSQVSFGQLKCFIDRMKKGNKQLWIIMGNHDRELQRYIKDQDYETSYDLLIGLGFDKVFEFPILIDDCLFSHEPVYLKPGSNLINVYGHTHDVLIDKDYFNRDCENWAMMERVKKEGITEQKNLDIDTSVKPLGKLVDVDNYVNVCWDANKRFIPLGELLKS